MNHTPPAAAKHAASHSHGRAGSEFADQFGAISAISANAVDADCGRDGTKLRTAERTARNRTRAVFESTRSAGFGTGNHTPAMPRYTWDGGASGCPMYIDGCARDDDDCNCCCLRFLWSRASGGTDRTTVKMAQSRPSNEKFAERADAGGTAVRNGEPGAAARRAAMYRRKEASSGFVATSIQSVARKIANRRNSDMRARSAICQSKVHLLCTEFRE
jgi:hypothetical protein